MDTYITLTAYGRDAEIALSDAEDKLTELLKNVGYERIRLEDTSHGVFLCAISLDMALLGFIPGSGVYLVEMLLPIIGTIAIGILLEKNKSKRKNVAEE